MDPKTYEPAQPPLITQIQPVQMPLLPQVSVELESDFIHVYNKLRAQILACYYKRNIEELYSAAWTPV